MNPVGIAALLCFIASAPIAAENLGGMRGEVTLGFGAIQQDGPATSNSLRPLGGLVIGLSSETRTELLRFDLNADVVPGNGAQSDAVLKYTRKTKSSQLQVRLRHRARPAGASGLEVISRDTERLQYVDISQVNAKQRVSEAAFAFRTGLGRPIGVDVEARHRRRSAESGIGPQQIGRRKSLDVAARFDLDRRSTLHLRLGYSGFDGDGAIRTEEKSRLFQLGLSHNMNARTTLEVELGRNALRGTRAGIWRDQSGSEWRAGITRTRSMGKVYAFASRDFTSAGGLTELTLGMHRESSDAILGLEIGAARLSGAEVEPTLDLSFAQTIGATSWNLRTSRGYFASDFATEPRLATRGSLRLTHEISDNGQLDLRFDVVKSTPSATLPEQSMRQIRLGYTHNLSRDWGIAGGAQRRVSQEGTAPKASSNGVFLRLERHFAGSF